MMLKQIKWRSLLVAAAYIVAGLFLIIYPESSRHLIAYVLGTAVVVYGIVSLTTYFVINVKESLHRNEFVIGIMAIIGGLIIIVKQQVLLDLIPVLLGLVIITDGFDKLQSAVVAKRIGASLFSTYVVLSLVSIVIGIVVMFFLGGVELQKTLFVVIGVGLVYCGISDIFVTLFIAGKFHQFLKDYEKGVVQHQEPIKEAEISDITEVQEKSNESKPE